MYFEDELLHYGTPRHSGRYPWGSGENPYQHSGTLLGRIDELKAAGMTEKQIADELGISTTQLRARKAIELSERTAWEQAQCTKLHDDGYSNVQIGRMMGIPESTVRNRLNPTLQERTNRYEATANVLKEQIENGKPYLDVGKGVDKQLGVSETQLKTAIAMLEEQGYKVSYLKVEQATNPNQSTSVKVLTKEDVPYQEIYQNRDKVMSPMGTYTEDGGRTWNHINPPVSIDSSRIGIAYYENGGKEKDGVIEIRPGVSDLTLGQSSYAQVRIAVDGTHYLKGMAMYNDQLPPGVDIRFNTNKHEGTPMLGDKQNSVLKPIKSDPDNPFGSTIRQFEYSDPDGTKHQSPINIVNDDSDWGKWSKNLSSQMLSKQEPMLAKRQLDLAYKEKRQEFEALCEYTNPAIKRKLLLSFADECDSDAVHLKAAALPRQQTHVILPITTLKDNEVYAPNYKTGEEVVLIRYPHQGTFEIPRLTVNNNNPEGKRLLGNPKNAIGINSHVADRLSGADFDGDTVVVIPTKGQNIKTSSPLKGLENFDPKERYRAYPGMPEVGPKTGFHKQTEMGKISNLVTDMTLKGATMDEIAAATRHAQVVIDAEKHNLNWRQSYEDNRIAALKEKYQGGATKGASTLISKASSDDRVPVRKDFRATSSDKGGDIDPKTGKKLYRESGDVIYEYKGKSVFKDKNGDFYYKDKKTGTRTQVPSDKVKEKPRLEVSNKMTEAFNKGYDAYSLSSGTRMENYYAEHANKMKSLANEARKEYLATQPMKVNKSAKETYAAEVKSLNDKLDLALQNAPRERQAQLLANSYIARVKRANPDIEKDELKKKRSQAIDEARSRTGTLRRDQRNIEITDREWKAIQAGAISNNKLTQILANTDEEKLKERAMPRTRKTISPAALARAKAMINAGYTQAEAAEAIGVSASTLNKAI